MSWAEPAGLALGRPAFRLLCVMLVSIFRLHRSFTYLSCHSRLGLSFWHRACALFSCELAP
jgi:hypothetical protein